MYEASRKSRLPLPAKAGSPRRRITYGFDFFDAGRQTARLVDQILRGVPPGDIPVETTELSFAINLDTARAINLGISDKLLEQADKVYESLKDF